MSKGWTAFWIMCAIIAVLFGCAVLEDVTVTPWESAYEYAKMTCSDLGYQRHYEYRKVWFCVTYGLEPKITRLGTQSELSEE